MRSGPEQASDPSASSGSSRAEPRDEASAPRDHPSEKKKVMWHVYIVHCSDDTLYTGTAKNVSRRVKRHNAKDGCAYTRTRTPVKLVYQEPRPSYSTALKREAQIKRWSRAKKLARIKGDIETLANLAKSHD